MNRIVRQEWPLLRLPLAAVIVNIVGCCAIGVLAGLVATGRLPMRTNWREFVFAGILGGFTTFSTCGLDTITLIRSADVVCGLAAVHFGLAVVERFGVVAR